MLNEVIKGRRLYNLRRNLIILYFMMFQKKIVQEYPLVNKVDFSLDCYMLKKRRYLIFWNRLIEKKSIKDILIYLEEKTNNNNFPKYKTLIIFGETKDEFSKNDLVYFNTNTYVVFYLINDDTNDIYMDDSWISEMGLNYKKYVRRINDIVKKGI